MNKNKDDKIKNELTTDKIEQVKKYLAKDDVININLLLHLLHGKKEPMETAIKILAEEQKLKITTAQKVLECYEKRVVRYLAQRHLETLLGKISYGSFIPGTFEITYEKLGNEKLQKNKTRGRK